MRLTWLITLCLCISLCSGCSFLVEKARIQQGNIITQDMISQLKPGMTEQQVQYILGSPVLVDTFSDHRYSYVYSFTLGKKIIREKQLTIFFRNGRVTHFRASGI